MNGNPRRLTADGRVCSATHVILDPAKDDLVAIRLFGSWGVDCGAPSVTHDPVECGVCLPSEAWFEGAANTWDATCTTCKDVESAAAAWARDPMAFAQGCAACKGTGVDETIPLHLIGPGSVLSHNRVDGREAVVISRELDVGGCDDLIVAWFNEEVSDHETELVTLARPSWDEDRDVGPDRTWTVVRAVPPAHTEATP
jgi:hypothetical protein